MNEYDSAKLYRLLSPEYSTAASPDKADLILVNTCSVREKPAQKLFSLLGELRPLKAANPSLLIGVGGCVAQQQGKNILKRCRDVDFVFGTHNLSLVPSLIAMRKEGAPPQVAVDYRDEWEELPLGSCGPGRVSVFISISRGCNKKCSFCIVPATRGKEVSRDPAEIEREILLSVRQGAKEVVLLGQSVNSYGRDLSPRLDFAALIDRVSGIEGLERIRFTSPHPQEVRENFVRLVSENPKVCRHIHLPLQSGSDRILRMMRRSYTRDKYMSIIDSLRKAVPDIAFTTDLIVGFPGESEKDFEDTLEVMEYSRFDSSFSFMFSPRPGTPAENLPDHLPEDEKLRRLQVLQKRQEKISEGRLSEWVGKRGEVLLEGESPGSRKTLQGRLPQNIVVHLDKEYRELTPGMTVGAEILHAGRHTLKGRPTGGAALATCD